MKLGSSGCSKQSSVCRTFSHNMSNDSTVDLASLRYLNESAIKVHALECSRVCRAGKFTRVGQPFVDEVIADVECVVREIKSGKATIHPPVAIESEFVTGALLEKIRVVLNERIAKIIQNKIQAQPSLGCTAGRTR